MKIDIHAEGLADDRQAACHVPGECRVIPQAPRDIFVEMMLSDGKAQLCARCVAVMKTELH